MHGNSDIKKKQNESLKKPWVHTKKWKCRNLRLIGDKLTYFLGVNIGSEDVSLEAGPIQRPFYMYLRVILPISVSVLALLLTLTAVAVCLRRSKLLIS